MNGMNPQLMAQAGPLQSAIAELEQDFERENAELDRQEQLLREEQEFARQQREQDMLDELAARQEARRAERGQDMADDEFRQSVQTAPKREQALYGEGTFQPRHAGGVVHRTEYPGEAPGARERRLERTERRVYGPDSLEAEARGLGYSGVSDFVRGPGGVSEDIDAALGAAPEGDDEVQAAIDAGREARTARERAAQTARRGREASQYGRGLRRRRPRQDTPYHEREYRGLDRYLNPRDRARRVARDSRRDRQAPTAAPVVRPPAAPSSPATPPAPPRDVYPGSTQHRDPQLHMGAGEMARLRDLQSRTDAANLAREQRERREQRQQEEQLQSRFSRGGRRRRRADAGPNADEE